MFAVFKHRVGWSWTSFPREYLTHPLLVLDEEIFEMATTIHSSNGGIQEEQTELTDGVNQTHGCETAVTTPGTSECKPGVTLQSESAKSTLALARCVRTHCQAIIAKSYELQKSTSEDTAKSLSAAVASLEGLQKLMTINIPTEGGLPLRQPSPVKKSSPRVQAKRHLLPLPRRRRRNPFARRVGSFAFQRRNLSQRKWKGQCSNVKYMSK